MILEYLAVSMIGLFVALCTVGATLIVMDADEIYKRKKRRNR